MNRQRCFQKIWVIKQKHGILPYDLLVREAQMPLKITQALALALG